MASYIPNVPCPPSAVRRSRLRHASAGDTINVFTTMANGDILIPESRLRAALTVAAVTPELVGGPRAPDRAGSLEDEIARLLGQPWDDELEPFRCAGDGAPVRWLHATG